MSILDRKVDDTWCSEMFKKRAVAEVFSIRFVREEDIHGVILLRASNRNYVIFQDRGDEEDSLINSEGYFSLTEPQCAVEVDDALVIYPWLFNGLGYCDDNVGVTLWQRSPSSLETDRFIRKVFETGIGIMRVDFAVYSDAVDAKLEVALHNSYLNKLLERDKPIQIYGTIKASNSVANHSEAKISLFDHSTSQKCLTLDPRWLKKDRIPLPLSKSMIAIPTKSILFVEINLYLHCGSQDIHIIDGVGVFLTRPSSDSTLTSIGNSGSIDVKILFGQKEKHRMPSRRRSKSNLLRRGGERGIYSAGCYGMKARGGKGLAVSNVDDEVMSFMSFGQQGRDIPWLLQCLQNQGCRWIEHTPLVVKTCPIKTLEHKLQQQLNDVTILQPRFRKRTLVEIFSVLLLGDVEPGNLLCFEDDIFVGGKSREYVLWKKSDGKFNLEGYPILTGPDRGIEVEENFSISPYYNPDDDKVLQLNLWLTPPDSENPCRDYFLSRYSRTKDGFMEVRLGVYSDGVEARLEVVLSDLRLGSLLRGEPFQVYGTVKAFNSIATQSEARSLLFDHRTNQESVTLMDRPPRMEDEIPLPLSRSVTVIPRDCSLVVDFNLYVCCATENVCIAYGPVLFPASTRCNGLVEEMIILGRFANVKVKAAWVEDDWNSEKVGVVEEEVGVEQVDGGGEAEEDSYVASEDIGEMETGDDSRQGIPDEKGSFRSFKEDDGNSEKEGVVEEDVGVEQVDGGGEAREDSYVASEGSGEMETADDSCQGIPDEKGSFQCLKVPLLDWEEDVSTRANEYCLREPSECEEEKQGYRFKDTLLELFSVRFIDFEKLDATQIYGFILLETGNPLYYVFKRVLGDPLPIDSEGFVMLEGPKLHAMSIYDDVVIRPFLFKYQDFEFTGEGIPLELLWNENSDRFQSVDKVLSKIVNSQFGPLEVHYAVFGDGVEARLRVMLTGCRFSSVEVYGRITATCPEFSDPKARTMVFNREEDNAIHVGVRPGEETSLPLCRPIVVLRYDSSLVLDVAIHSRDKIILSGSIRFNPSVCGVNSRSLSGNDCSVEVVVDLLAS